MGNSNETAQRREIGEAAGEEVDSCASPPCFLHELDEAWLGYMTRPEVLELLNRLLEAERAGARGVGLMSRQEPAASRRDALRRVAADEAAFCAMLARHIVRFGGAPSRATGAFYDKLASLDTVGRRLELLDRGQGWVARKLREALPRIADDPLYRDLRDMLETHEANIARCARLRGDE